MTDLARIADQVRWALSSPRKVVRGLGLKPEQETDRYALVRCPVHGDRKSASCSVYAKNGTVNAKCRGCDWRTDVFGLVAAVEGLDRKRDWRDVLASAAELAGMSDEADELRSGRPVHVRKPLPPPPPAPAPEFPPEAEVRLLWSACIPVTEDAEVAGLLRSRRIDPIAVATLGAAAALDPRTHQSSVPRWARFKGRLERSAPWTSTGHRLIVPVFDHEGAMRSVRAWLVTGADGVAKRVPPAGYRASGLVVANARAQRWLRGDSSPSMIVVCEGEPDTLARTVAFPNETIVGVGSGSWTDEFAARVPYGCQVVLMTHLDEAGDRYADAIADTVKGRAQVTRWTIDEEPEEAA